MFNLGQGSIEPLKRYLDEFNKATVLVEEPNKKFFVAAFMKGLKNGGFSEALSIWKLRNMDEVRVWADKHVEAEETTKGKKKTNAKEPRRYESSADKSE